MLHFVVRRYTSHRKNFQDLVELVRHMIANGSDVNAVNDKGEGVLHACADEGYVEVSIIDRGLGR